MTDSLAFVRIIGSAIPIVAIVLMFGIPIVAILTAHQRRMAELMHQRRGDNEANLAQELLAMRREMSDLRDRINALTLASDARSALSASTSVSPASEVSVHETTS